MNRQKHKLPRRILAVLLTIAMMFSMSGSFVPTSAQAAPVPEEIIGGTGNNTENVANLVAAGTSESPGVTIIQENGSDTTYNIGEGQVVMIANQNNEEPIIFENCTFNLSGKTSKISGTQNGIKYNNGETVTKLFISGNVTFINCLFITQEGATKSTSAGYDAAIYFYSGNINLNQCTAKAENYNGQFLGLYGSDGAVTFTDSIISTEGNKNGWSYAMYAGAVLKLNHSMMTATGMSTDDGNINAFYSGDNNDNYEAIFIDNSIVDFSDNSAGGFAINNVDIHVSNGSSITVNNNKGNACNSGYWIVEDSSITMNGNRGGHALSCVGFEMIDSTLEILHNGYAGVYLQSKDSSLTNCTVDIRCNGENYLSYSAGDVWLQGHKLTVDGCTSKAQEDSAWLGGVGRTGDVETLNGSSIVAYDLNSNAADNLKSNTEPVLTKANIALSGEKNEHTLLLNPFMETPYARGNAETSASNNDADLFADDEISGDITVTTILGERAKIGKLTDAQLAHHKYDWNAGRVEYDATADTYGAMAYPCTDVCANYVNNTDEHPNSRNCAGTYVYAPLVGLEFDDNVDDDSVTNMPADQTDIAYEGTATEPTQAPTRTSDSTDESWEFTGWYSDPECTALFDFSSILTENWTTVYAGWKKIEGTITITPANVTIYMGGNDGYEAVVGGNTATTATNSLPEPLFYINIPGVNKVDLEQLKFTNNDRNLSWTAEYAGDDAAVDGQPLYRLVSGPENEDPVRVQYLDGSSAVTSDEFEPTLEGDLYKEYEIKLYYGGNDPDDVKATYGDATYSVSADAAGKLIVRAVDNTENTPATNPVHGITNGTTGESVALDDNAPAAITAPADTTYTLNETTVSVDATGVGLLFDGIINDDAHQRTEALINKVNATMGGDSSNRQYQAQYLDLVDENNGNAWVKASNPVTITWAYPDGTNRYTEFKLYHFKGLHRDDSAGGQSGFDINDVANIVPEDVNINTDENGITFTVSSGGFSPFVLVWEEDDPYYPPYDPGDDDEEEPDTPALDRVNHFLYVEGYPEDYRTGEYSDNEDLWPVKPQGNITRAEVATIFYRLLKDEVREEIETDVNSFPDVNEDDWFNVTVSSLANMGAISGYEDGTFRPNEPISRAELASMAVRFYDAFEVEYEEGTFLDVDGDEWYADAIAAAEELGIIGGYPDGTVRPEANITRAETCAIVNRVLERRPHDEHLGDVDDMRTWPDNQPGAWYYADMQEATNGHYYEWIDIDGSKFEEWTEVDKDYDWTKR